MNLLDYPKEYFDVFFRAKKLKAFNFNKSIVEFLVVLLFAGAVNGIAMYFSEQFDAEILLYGLLILLFFYSLMAAIFRGVFMLFKGKSTLKKDAAVVYKYAAGLTFWVTVLGILTSIPGFAESILLQVIAVSFFLYLSVVTFLNIFESTTELEKLSPQASYQVYALSLVVLFLLVVLIGFLLFETMPDELLAAVQ